MPGNLNFHRLFRWSKILGLFAAGQLGIQAIAALTGFLLIRLLTKEHYAWFTLASTLAATISVLSDSGVTVAVTSRAGKLWQDKSEFASLIASGLRVRGIQTVLAAFVAGPLTLWLLTKNGLDLTKACLLVCIVILGAWPGAGSAILQIINRMHSNFKPLIASELLTVISRLILSSLLGVTGFLSVYTAIIAVTLSQWLQWVTLSRQTQEMVPWHLGATRAYQGIINKTVVRFFPNSVFQCLQGHLATWLVSGLSNTSNVADFGALSRLAIFFTIIAAPVYNVASPAFAKCQEYKRLKNLAIFLPIGFFLGAVAVVAITYLLPEPFLWVLGSKYAGLSSSLSLMTMSMALASFNQLLWALCMARGWIKNAWLQIPACIAVQVAVIPFLPLHTINGAIVMTMCSTLPSCILALFVMCLGVRDFRNAKTIEPSV